MAVRVTDGGLVLEVTDPVLQALARAAVEAVGDQAPEPGTLAGDLPVSDSLAEVWLALRDSLEDIRQRAARASQHPGAGHQEEQGGPEKAGPPRENPGDQVRRGRAGRPLRPGAAAPLWDPLLPRDLRLRLNQPGAEPPSAAAVHLPEGQIDLSGLVQIAVTAEKCGGGVSHKLGTCG